MIVDLTIRDDNYNILDKVDGITPHDAISLLIIKYSVKWDNKIKTFKAKELQFQQFAIMKEHGKRKR